MYHIFLNRSRKDLDKSRIKGEEKAVRGIRDVIKSMINLFDNDHESLVHIARRLVASPDIEDDMKHMVDKAKTAFTSFFENHIVGEKPNIYSTINKTNLKTFSCLEKKVMKADPHFFKDVEIFVSHEEMCHKFFQSNDILVSCEVEELCYDHEEDTRMLVHASHTYFPVLRKHHNQES